MDGIVEGRNSVREALLGDMRVREVFIALGTRQNDVLDDIRRLAADAGIRVSDVDRNRLDGMSERGSHQGVVARVAPFEYAPLEEVAAVEGDALVFVLDHITDPGNLGAIVRSAEALGAAAIVIPKARAAGMTPVAMKTAAGAAAHIPIARVSNVARSIAALKDAGFWVAGASERGEGPAWDAPLEGRLAVVMGAEGEGLSRLVEESCDFLVRIPLVGKTSSLNVAQAATVLAYEWSRRGTR